MLTSTTTRPLGIVVTTIGRREPLLRLIASIEDADAPDVVLVVAVQGGDPDLTATITAACDRRGIASVVRASAGGASRGRNDAAAWVDGQVEVLCFPNDTTVLLPGTLRRLIDRVADPTFTAGALTIVDDQGPKFVLPSAGVPLDRRNVWSVILPGLVVRASVFARCGRYDETIGTGAPTPWQSGEETVLLLRFLDLVGPDFRWMPDIAWRNPHDAAGLAPAARRRKLRGYARGYGRVLRLERYGVLLLARSLVAGITFGLRHGAPYSPADGFAVALGRLEGWTGIAVGHRTRTALVAAPAVLRSQPTR